MNAKMTENFWAVNSRVQKYRNLRKFCDVVIRVEERTFHCHRVVLASMSPYFDTMFSGNFEERKSPEVTLQHFDAEIFESILDYMYTGCEPDMEADNIYELLHASDFFGVADLTDLCHDYIKENLRNGTASSMNIAKLYNFIRTTRTDDDSLERLLLDYILEHFATFTRTRRFLQMPYDDLSAVLRAYRAFASTSVPYVNEDFLLDGLIRWVHHAPNERKQYFEALFEMIVFDRISAKYMRFLAKDYQVPIEARSSDPICGLKEAIIESETSPTPFECLLFNRNATIHMYKSTWAWSDEEVIASVDRYTVYTMDEHKAELDLYESSSLCIPSSVDGGKPLSFVASEKLDFIYCLHHKNVPYERDTRFAAYSSTRFDQPTQLSIASPMREFRRPTLRTTGDSIFLYNPEMHTFNYNRSLSIWDSKEFSADEYQRGIYRYRCDIDAWLPVPEMKRRLAFSGLVADNVYNLLYLVGGVESGRSGFPAGTVQAYDQRASKWLEVRRSTYPYVRLPTCCSMDGKIYVTDGIVMEVFHPVAGRWADVSFPLMPEAGQQQRSPMWMVPYEGRVHYFHKVCSTMSILDNESLTWSEPVSFRNAMCAEDVFVKGSYGVQNVIVFKPPQVWEQC